MFKFLKSLRQLKKQSVAVNLQRQPLEYKGFKILPMPKQEAGGWSTEAEISQDVDGEVKTHHFIRADKSGSEEGAVELILSKCQKAIDQMGNNIFR